jgi:hypothetical protein
VSDAAISHHDADQPLRASWAQIALRACFLACSWCWCIGTWLPVYLCREFGWPGWAAFLVPNCIGAAAVGVIVQGRAGSLAMERDHPAALRWFSIVTIAFHAWFLGALLTQIVPLRYPVDALAGAGWAGAFVLGAMFVGSRWTSRAWNIAAVVTLGLSLGMWLGASLTGSSLQLPPDTGPGGLGGLAMAFPVIAIGFLLCPLMDLTFHRVCREMPRKSAAASFIIAFGVVFPVLLGFSLLYAGGAIRGWLSYYVAAHVAIQCTFTMGAHWRELRERWRSGAAITSATPHRATPHKVAFAAALLLLAAVGAWLATAGDLRPGYTLARLGYELFMSMYGLVFPAYVWIVMVQRGVALRARIIAWLIAIALASPLFWVGYIQQQYVWLLPGVGIVLATPLVLRAACHRDRAAT